jgi:hypothetical protein
MSFTAMKIEYEGNTYLQDQMGIITKNGVKVTWDLSEQVRVWPEVTSPSSEEDDNPLEADEGTHTTMCSFGSSTMCSFGSSTMCSFGSSPSSDGYGSELDHYIGSDGEYNPDP